MKGVVVSDAAFATVPNSCAPSALSALTGEPADVWLDRLRQIDPMTCTRHQGTNMAVLRDTLRHAGYVYEHNNIHMPLHLVLAQLRGRKAILVIQSGARRHAIAAEGFMVCDNAHPYPVWFADWLYSKNRKRYTVVSVTIIGGK